MNRYLSGQFQPGKKVLISCLNNLFKPRFEWSVQPLMEIEPIPENTNDLPTTSGLYILYDSAGSVLYVGQALNFRREVKQTLSRQIPVGLRFGPNLRREPKRYPMYCDQRSSQRERNPRRSIQPGFLLECLEIFPFIAMEISNVFASPLTISGACTLPCRTALPGKLD